MSERIAKNMFLAFEEELIIGERKNKKINGRRENNGISFYAF